MIGEREAREWVESRPWITPAMMPRLEYLVDRTSTEATRQNLFAPSTLDHMWDRHVRDSLQLVDLAGRVDGQWLDIGSGGGFPGLAFGAIGIDILCVEPRKNRAAFMRDVAESWPNVKVICASIEHVTGSHSDVITARAVAPATRIFALARHLATRETMWILPAGRTAHASLADARRDWAGVFHVEQSVTSADAGIIVAENVARRQR